MPRNSFKYLITLLFFLTVSLFSTDLKACDTSPILTLSNVTDIGGGFFTVDVQACMGDGGSINGFTTSVGGGTNITSFTPPALVDNNIATGSLGGGVLDYNFAAGTVGNPFVVNGANTCFNYTITVDADPAGQLVTFVGINHTSCAISTTGTATVPAPCFSDFSITAPTSQAGSTVGAGNTCPLRGSQDQIIEVVLPCNETYTFSLCGNATWDTYLYLSSSCCGASIALNDDACGLQSSITSVLAAGTYYVAVEAFSTATTGAYTLDVTSANPCVLPIELLVFEGSRQEDNMNLISWETSSEINNDFFIIERGEQKETQIFWKEIGEIDGAGNSNNYLSYEFIDMNPNYNDISYYRLNQIDFDGSSKYSKTISIDNSVIDEFGISNLYPNPASDKFSFSLFGKVNEEEMSVSICSSLGVVVKTQSFSDINNNSNFNLDVADLEKGIYFVSVTVGDFKEVKRITIVR
ncbi:MAG: T9SS type A sorting domain-containing protein [Vicingaceae bacterium]|nr:T9SS type A sorting domain-containing protein [Vicingaceae bacterium]